MPNGPDPVPPAGECPPALARALSAYARHRGAADRFAAAVELYESSRAREEEQLASRAAGAAERKADRLARLEAAAGREAERQERAAAAAAHGALREAIERYARDLRIEAVPAQRMVTLVKSAVREAARDAEPIPEPESLIADILEWCISAYYVA